MRGHRWVWAVALASILILQIGSFGSYTPDYIGSLPNVSAAEPISGDSTDCVDVFAVGDGSFNALFNILQGAGVGIPDPVWVLVDRFSGYDYGKFRSLTGGVTRVEVSHTDFPAVHDSHDLTFDILVDEGQEDILSEAGKDNPDDPRNPDTLHVEWETGILPDEHSGDGSEPFFPKWAWPSKGDRVWVEGYWVFDCGHPDRVVYKTEIHPIRAVASMRDQWVRTPASGTTPIHATAVDLYIHGRNGIIDNILKCDGNLNTLDCSPQNTEIDVDYEFDICLPPKPDNRALLGAFVTDGPDNTFDIAPILFPQSSLEPDLHIHEDIRHFPIADCPYPDMIHVTVPLEGSDITPFDVYSRKIYAVWIYPSEDLKHFQLELNQMDLHDDKDPDPGDCECTFFWMNVNRAEQNEWIRLSDFDTGNMNDYDDDQWIGDGEMRFDGAIFDYYIADDLPINVTAHGYDQDCFDDIFGTGQLDADLIVPCYLGDRCTIEFECGDNDDYPTKSSSFVPPNYGVGSPQEIPPLSETATEWVKKFNGTDGELIESLITTGSVVDIEIDSSNNIYASTQARNCGGGAAGCPPINQIRKYDLEGNIVFEWGAGSNSEQGVGIELDSDNNVYAFSTNTLNAVASSVLKKYNSNGGFLGDILSFTASGESQTYIRDVAIDSFDDIYASINACGGARCASEYTAILKYDQEGNQLSGVLQIGSDTDGILNLPHVGIELDANNNVYTFVGAELNKYDRSGNFIGNIPFSTVKGELQTNIVGIAIDSSNNIYASINACGGGQCSGNLDRLVKVDQEGTELFSPTSVSSPNSGADIHRIGSIALDSSNNVYVRSYSVQPSDYELEVSILPIPISPEDFSNMSISEGCSPDTLQSYVCLAFVTNSGVGLPRDVTVKAVPLELEPRGSYNFDTGTFAPHFVQENTLHTSFGCLPFEGGGQGQSQGSISPQSHGGHDPVPPPPALFPKGEVCFQPDNEEFPCETGSEGVGHNEHRFVFCELGTVPHEQIGARSVVKFGIVVNTPDINFDNTVQVNTDSIDLFDDNDVDTFPVYVRDPDIINVANDLMEVHILTTPTFDATQLMGEIICFGDAEPTDRDCAQTSEEATPFLCFSGCVRDADLDGDKDMLVTYVASTVEDNDITACFHGFQAQFSELALGCDSMLDMNTKIVIKGKGKATTNARTVSYNVKLTVFGPLSIDFSSNPPVISADSGKIVLQELTKSPKKPKPIKINLEGIKMTLSEDNTVLNISAGKIKGAGTGVGTNMVFSDPVFLGVKNRNGVGQMTVNFNGLEIAVADARGTITFPLIN